MHHTISKILVFYNFLEFYYYLIADFYAKLGFFDKLIDKTKLSFIMISVSLLYIYVRIISKLIQCHRSNVSNLFKNDLKVYFA